MKYLTGLLLCLFMLPGYAIGQEVTVEDLGQVNPEGCRITWDEPSIPHPDNPDQTIGSWQHDGDLKGFATVSGDEPVWDPLKEVRHDNPDMRELSCGTIGMVDVKKHVFGLKAYDTSMNFSDSVWASLEIVEPDSKTLDSAVNVCVRGMFHGKQLPKTCISIEPE